MSSSKVAVVTGGTSGIGKATASAAQVEGISQFINAFSQPANFRFRPLEKCHGGTHGGFRPQAGHSGELIDKFFQRFGNTLHKSILLSLKKQYSPE